MKLGFVVFCSTWLVSHSFYLKSSKLIISQCKSRPPTMSIVDKEFAPLSTILEKLTDESKLYQPPDRFYNDDSNQSIDKNHFQSLAFLPLFLSVVGLMLTSNPLSAVAENLSFDPALFQPVCHFSDVVYQFFKAAVGMCSCSINNSTFRIEYIIDVTT